MTAWRVRPCDVKSHSIVFRVLSVYLAVRHNLGGLWSTLTPNFTDCGGSCIKGPLFSIARSGSIYSVDFSRFA